MIALLYYKDNVISTANEKITAFFKNAERNVFMDKQTFYSELSERLAKLDVSRDYIERHLSQFNSYFEGKNDEEIASEIERLGDLDRVAARIKRMTDKLAVQTEAVSEAEDMSSAPDGTQPLEQENCKDAPTEMSEDVSGDADGVSAAAPLPVAVDDTAAGNGDLNAEAVFEDDDVISFTPISTNTDASLDELFDDLAEKNADESFSPGHKRGREADVDPDHMVRSDLDEELVRKNTKKFWLLFAVTSPITLVVLGATAAAFALLFFLIAVLIIAFVAGLVAVTAAGTLISVLGLIFGVVQAITTLPIGLYECGLSIMIGASAMFVGIVLYNIAVRLLPYAAKWALLLVKLVIRKYKELFVYLKKECIGL